MIKQIGFICFLISSQNIFATPSALFQISASGSPASINITLCLDGKGPLSCQNYDIPALSLRINTIIPNHNYPSAGIKINTPGYSLDSLSCQQSEKGYCLFHVSQSTSALFTINKIVKHAYIATNGSQNVFQCSINANGTLSSCQTTPLIQPTWQPFSTTFTSTHNAVYAYVTDPDDAHLFKCEVSPSGALDTCNLTPLHGEAVSITFNTFYNNQYAYLASGGVQKCNVAQNGTLSSCIPTPTTGAPNWVVFSTSFAVINNNQYAYVSDANFFSGRLYVCDLNSDGTYVDNSCDITPSSNSPQWLPTSTTIQIFNNTPYAYIADRSGNIYQCTINSNGRFVTDSCHPTPSNNSPAWQPLSIAFATLNGSTYAYVADKSGNNIYQCSTNMNGALYNCNATPSSDVLWATPTWITLH